LYHRINYKPWYLNNKIVSRKEFMRRRIYGYIYGNSVIIHGDKYRLLEI
jgi:hypothetical protein